MSPGPVLALWVEGRQWVWQVKSLQRGLVMVEVYSTGTGPRARGDGGGRDQAGPGVKGAGQLHVAGAAARKRAVSSSSGFPDVLDGLCTGHLSSSCVYLAIRGESVCGSETDGNRLTSEGIKRAKKQAVDAPEGSQQDEQGKSSRGKCVISFQVSVLIV